MLAFCLSIVVVGLLTTLELRRGDRGDRRLNIQVWALGFGPRAVLVPLVALWPSSSLLDSSKLPFVAGFAVYLIVMDLGEYLFHRAQHAIPALWTLHSLHHSDEAMNATSTERHFWADPLLKAITIWPVAVLIVAPTPAILLGYLLVSLWNYLVHSSLPFSFGRFSWLLNSSAYHRRHHSSLPEHFNSNYAALFPVWDVLFGAYHRPSGFPRTGLEIAPRNIVDAAIWPVLAARTGAVRTPEALVSPAPMGTNRGTRTLDLLDPPEGQNAR